MRGDESPPVDPAFLRETPIFGGLPERVLSRLVAAIRVLRVETGTKIFAEGDLASCMFVVAEGELEICKRGRNGADFCLAVLGRGACVGEMSLIDIQARSASVVALSPAVLYLLNQADIAKLYETDLEVYALLISNIAREISRRLRCADQVLVDMGVAVQGAWAAPGTETK
jgi:CRP/FNR family transcriptional regulator, cyclic AMP receptor protein